MTQSLADSKRGNEEEPSAVTETREHIFILACLLSLSLRSAIILCAFALSLCDFSSSSSLLPGHDLRCP